jgi:membrane protein
MAAGRWGDVRAVAKEVVRRNKVDNLTDASAALAFWTFLSIFPALIGFVAVLGSLDWIIGSDNAHTVKDKVLEELDKRLAGQTLSSVRNVVVDIMSTPRAGLAVVGLAAALWGMSKGFASLCRALARIHGLGTRRDGLKGRALGLLLGAGTIVAVTLVALQVALGPLFGFQDRLPTGAGHAVLVVWAWVRTPFLAVVFVLWLTLLLKLGPGLHGSLWRFLPGGLVASVLLVVLLVATSIVVGLGLLQGNPLLGALGGVFVLLTVLNLLARAILIGGEVNAVRFERAARTAPAPADEIEAPAAVTTG